MPSDYFNIEDFEADLDKVNDAWEDESERRRKASELIPEGDRVAVIEEIKFVKSKHTGDLQVLWVLLFPGDTPAEELTREKWDNITDPEKIRFFMDSLTGLGIKDLPQRISIDFLKQLKEKYEGEQVNVHISHAASKTTGKLYANYYFRGLTN